MWVASERAIYWVDILAHRIMRYRVDTGVRESWQFEQKNLRFRSVA
jgi:sugar lactone lactonase YvrE